MGKCAARVLLSALIGIAWLGLVHFALQMTIGIEFDANDLLNHPKAQNITAVKALVTDVRYGSYDISGTETFARLKSHFEYNFLNDKTSEWRNETIGIPQDKLVWSLLNRECYFLTHWVNDSTKENIYLIIAFRSSVEEYCSNTETIESDEKYYISYTRSNATSAKNYISGTLIVTSSIIMLSLLFVWVRKSCKS